MRVLRGQEKIEVFVLDSSTRASGAIDGAAEHVATPSSAGGNLKDLYAQAKYMYMMYVSTKCI